MRWLFLLTGVALFANSELSVSADGRCIECLFQGGCSAYCGIHCADPELTAYVQGCSNGTVLVCCHRYPSDPCQSGIVDEVRSCSSSSPEEDCAASGGSWEGDHCESPILINLKNDSPNYHLTSAADGVWFDLNADGTLELVAWTQSGHDVGFLVLDRNGNGTIDNGAELFGDATTTNGFVALEELDGGPGVSDGTINSADPAYGQLQVWVDANHNGLSESAELTHLSKAGVTRINLAYSENRRHDQFGNSYRYEGLAYVRGPNGTESPRRIFDVFLVVQSE